MPRRKMTPLGFKRKELHDYESPATPDKDWENEEVYPEIHADGKLAEVMGAADLKAGDTFETKVLMRVKEHTKIEKDGKTTYRMTICIEAMDDIEDAESDDEGAYEEETELDESPVAVVLRSND